MHTLRFTALAATALLLAAPLAPAQADETCNSPYMARLIQGQEHYLHVWTLGVPGLGDGSDKLVTVDVAPGSTTYGQVIHQLSVGGRGEAHHMGFTDDRKQLWAGRLDDSRIFVFDVGTDPAKPRLVRTIDDFAARTGFVGPHTFYALPGRMMVQALSNAKDHGGATGIAVYSNQGKLVSVHPMPRGQADIGGGDGYGYDIAIHPEKNLMLTSSFAGRNNYMRDLGTLIQDPAAMKNFGNTMALWDLKTMRPRRVFEVPGAPLEIRWSLVPGQNWAVTATALTSKLWLIRQDGQGEWQAREVATIGDPAKVPLPVDISIAADGTGLWVNTFMDGKTRYFDMRDPEHPRQTFEQVTGRQANMVSQSWDGKRLYITSSLLAHWDKKGADDEQYLKAYTWDGQALRQDFVLDFYQARLGRAHHMKFSAGPGTARAGAPSAARRVALRP